MSFITCQLMGGLGNQLFQIATCIASALEINTEFFLIENNPDFIATTGNNPSKYYTTIYKKIPKRLLSDGLSIGTYNEPKFSYTNFLNDIQYCKNNNIGVILKGYFQSELYFEKYKKTIKNIFTPEEGLEIYIRTQTNLFNVYPELDPTNTTDTKKRAFLGVRRGDYLKHSEIHNPASMEYYTKAMNLVNADYYYIVSDDIGWCKTQFIGPQYLFFEEPDDLRTFFFMRLFKTYICANSTFHWWASYLSIYENPVVYTPKEHFGPKGVQDYQDYFRKDMILISNLKEISKNPEITINIPLYNGIEYLSEAISSIQSQTYTRWKCIIGVNGHGADGGEVYKKASEYVQYDTRFKVINYPEAKCVSDVNTMMLKDSFTEWIAHLDADDIWKPTKLEVQVDALNTYAIEADVLGTECIYFDTLTGKPSIKSGWVSTHDLIQCNQLINSSTLFKKSIIKYSDRFICEDYEAWITLSLKGKKIYNIPQELVYHRIYTQSHFNASKKQDPVEVVNHYIGNEPFTLVTAFYEMKSKFSIDKYLQWISSFFSTYPGYMVIYTEKKFESMFMAMRSDYAEKTHIICAPLSSWGAVKDFPSDFWEQQHELDHEKVIHSPELYMIWYQKNDFVQKTIKLNPFNHTKFMWCDAGVVRNPLLQNYISSMIHGERILKNKISVLEIKPFTTSEILSKEPIEFQYNNNRIGGGVITGGIEAWIQWDKHYKEMIKEFLDRNWFIGKDQTIFANMVLRWPQDVHIVKPIKNNSSFDYWFYMIYYYGCNFQEFIIST